MMVFISNGKVLVSVYSGHHQVLTTFFAKEFYRICLNRVAMLRSHHHLRAYVRLRPTPATYKSIDAIDIPQTLA